MASKILITGASGFVGARLTAAFRDEADVDVRVLVRDADGLESSDGLEVVEGDIGDAETLAEALDGVVCAYYLVHSMEGGGDDFSEQDRELAEGFVTAVDTASVDRVVYLGGVDPGEDASEHLSSRLEVERTLAGARASFVALRASMIVGAESASFRTLAQIVDRLPVLALPSWRGRQTQPVAIDDVVAALIAARHVDPGHYDIAGPDCLTFEAMTELIAELLHKPHRSINLPFSNAGLEGAAASVLTDADRELLTPVMAGLHEDLVVSTNCLEPVFGVTPTPFREAAEAAIRDIDELRAPAADAA